MRALAPRPVLQLVLGGVLSLTLGSCACDPPVLIDDAGPDPVVDAGPGDAGLPPELDAGVDAGPPPTPNEIAREVCLALRTGEANFALQEAQEFAPDRCAPTDPLLDVEQIGAVLEPGACTQADSLFRDLEESIRTGSARFDLNQLDACRSRGRGIRATNATQADFVARATALAALAGDAACADIAEGLLSPGEVCKHAFECPDGTGCEADPLDDVDLHCLAPAQEGTRCDDVARGQRLAVRTCGADLVCVLQLCTRPIEEGFSCAGDVPCAEGLVCNPDGQLCEVPPPPPPPNTTDDGEPCADAGPCAGRCSVCRPSADVDRCAAPGAAGEGCEVDDHCRLGLRCSDGQCEPLADLGAPCELGGCAAGLVCVAPAPDAGVPDDGGVVLRCEDLADVGESCADRGCADGFCEGGTCRAGVAEDPCSGNAACASGHLCLDNLCVVSPREGAPCTSDGRCDVNLFCVDDRCRSAPEAGDDCFAGDICEERSFCNQGVCALKRLPGEACSADGECISGDCLDTLTCAATGASCLTANDTLAQLIGLALVLLVPRLRRRARRRRARRRR